ncbi:MAG TPA: translational machinery protein [bacterium]|nr:translational machinery protein [bacterium]HEV2440303.1 translational machinery protein [bacterium]
MLTHAVVWIDHNEARVFHVQPETPGHVQPEPVDETTILSPQHLIHRHPKGRGEAKEHPEDATRFFHEVARSVDSVDTVLVVGPASAKLEFLKYLQGHDEKLHAKVAGIETVDHPTDREIVAYARKYFKGSDRM